MGKDTEEVKEGKTPPSPAVLFVKLLFTPMEGWKAIKRAAWPLADLSRGIFYPMLALAAAVQFVNILYDPTLSVAQTLEKAIVVFISLFASSFCVGPLASVIMPKLLKEPMESLYGKSVVVMAMSTLALFCSIYTLLPMIGEVLIFLPIYTLYLVAKGCRLFRLKEENSTIGITLVDLLIIALPVCLSWLLTAILPAA